MVISVILLLIIINFHYNFTVHLTRPDQEWKHTSRIGDIDYYHIFTLQKVYKSAYHHNMLFLSLKCIMTFQPNWKKQLKNIYWISLFQFQFVCMFYIILFLFTSYWSFTKSVKIHFDAWLNRACSSYRKQLKMVLLNKILLQKKVTVPFKGC